MKIEEEHIQPMTFGRLMSQMIQKGKEVFVLSLPGNLLILGIFITILFVFFDFIAALGFDQSTLALLRTFNNAMIFSLAGVNVFYLLLSDSEAPYQQQVKTALLKTLKIIPILIVATIAYSLLVTVGLGLLIIPGVLVYTYLGIYSQTIAFENQGMFSSLMRSRNIVRGSFWKVLGLLLSIMLISNLVVVSLEITLRLTLPIYTILLDIGLYTFLHMMLMPFIGSLYALIYFDLRARQEAFDYSIFHKERSKIFD